MAEFRGWGGAAIVTGATSGIGLEIARQLAERQMNLILVARSAANLKVLAQNLASSKRITAVPVAYDLSDPQLTEHLPEIFRGIDLEVDLLVNNAGIGVYGPFTAQPAEREAEMIRLNTIAPTVLTKMFLPGMLRRRRGVILNVASTAAFQPTPNLASYAGTKAHLVSMTHSLDTELAGTGVRCQVLCPGTTATNFSKVSGAATHQARRLPEQTAVAVAEAAMRGLDKGQRIIVPGAMNRAHSLASGLLPDSWKARMAASVMRPKRGL